MFGANNNNMINSNMNKVKPQHNQYSKQTKKSNVIVIQWTISNTVHYEAIQVLRNAMGVGVSAFPEKSVMKV